MCEQLKRKLLLFISMIAVLIPIFTVPLSAQDWTSVTEGIYQDPVTKDFVFTSVDKEKTSEIYYRTFGFTVASHR